MRPGFVQYCLPTEILVACLDFLPLWDRLHVSQVCRHWRFISLEYTAVWARFELAVWDSADVKLLKHVLPRTRTRPLDLTLSRGIRKGFHVARALADVLKLHMYHMRSVDWNGGINAAYFRKRAPLLERLHCVGGAVRSDFLGGVPGVLRDLHIDRSLGFQKGFCPVALKTVTRLHLELSRPAADASKIFAACPRLEVLNILTRSRIPILPRTPAPRTLRELRFEFISWEHDRCRPLYDLLATWDIKRIAYVELVGVRGNMLRDLPRISIEQSRIVGTNPETGTTHVMKHQDTHPDRSLNLRARFIQDAMSSIEGREELVITSHALALLCYRRAVLPTSVRVITLTPDADGGQVPVDCVWSSIFSASAILDRVSCDFANQTAVVNLFFAIPWAYHLSTHRLVKELRLRNLPLLSDPFILLRLPGWCEQLIFE